MRTWSILAVLGVVLAAGVLVACGGDEGPVVNVYSARSHYGTEEVFTRFTDETGIEVKILGGEPAALVERINAEGQRTDADLLISTDAGFLWRATELNLLAPVRNARLEKQVPAHLRDPRGRWFAISRRARTIMRSTVRVPEAQAPTTYDGLGDPRWKGRVCLRTSNNIYNQSLVATLIAERGAPSVKAMLTRWMANQPTIRGSDTEVLKAIAQGTCDIGLTNTYYLGNALRDDPSFPVTPVWAEQRARGTHINVSGVGLTRFARHRPEAIRLMEYLLTPEAQGLIAEGNSEYPVRAGVKKAEWIAAWGEFRADSVPLVVAGRFQADAVRMMNEVGWT